MSTFKVGEVVVIQNQVGRAAVLNGCEVTIVEGLEHRYLDEDRGVKLCYAVDLRLAHGGWANAEPYELRRKRPPTTGEESIIAMFHKDKQPEGETV